MAGSANPNIDNLGKEAEYTLLDSYSTNQGQGGASGLFNDNTPDEWNSKNVFYWTGVSNYVDIEITSPTVNIWRSGTATWAFRNDTLNILKWNGISYSIDVTSQYSIPCGEIINGKWEIFVTRLPRGKYRFIHLNPINNRMDSEWYIEELLLGKYLLQSNNKIFTLDNNTLVTLKNVETSSELYKGYGFKDISLLNNKLSKTSIQGNSIEIDAGKCFEIPILDVINSIESVVIRQWPK